MQHCKIIIAVVLFWRVFASSFGFAQATSPTVLDLKMAQSFADKAFEYATKKGWRVTVAIVNSEGNLVLLNRGDGAYVGSIDAAVQKARSANAFQRSTSEFVNALAQGRTGLLAVRDIVPLEGGVPVTWNGVHLGAIGVSGAKSVEDEECAIFAIGKTTP